MSLSKANTKAIQDIESATLLVCLDDTAAPPTEDARAWNYWAGGHDRSSKGKGFNRWFDKHQIIVDSNGETGFNGERELMNGMRAKADVRLDARRNAHFAAERVHPGQSGQGGHPARASREREEPVVHAGARRDRLRAGQAP